MSIRIREPDSRLHVYDSERDIVDSHDFGEVRHFPVSHYWDPLEPKLLACETRRMRIVPADYNLNCSSLEIGEETGKKYHPLGLRGSRTPANDSIETRSSLLQRKLARKVTEESGPLMEVTTLFVTAEYGILLQDAFALEPPLEALLGVQVPRLFFTRCGDGVSSVDDGEVGVEDDTGAKTACQLSSNVGLCGRVMRDFVGLDDADARTRSALLDFSFYLTVGNMDEAHRAVRLIKSPSVWENMAHMCVKTKRLDVAEVCLGHMGHARGAAAVRAAKTDVAELEARVAAVRASDNHLCLHFPKQRGIMYLIGCSSTWASK